MPGERHAPPEHKAGDKHDGALPDIAEHEAED